RLPTRRTHLFPYTTLFRSSSRLYAMPPPDPPSVNEGRITTGKPIFAANSNPSRRLLISADRGISSPIRVIASLNNNRSSAFLIRSEEHTSELQSLAYLVCR